MKTEEEEVEAEEVEGEGERVMSAPVLKDDEAAEVERLV